MSEYIYSDMDPALEMLETGTVKIRYNAEVIDRSLRNIIATITNERVRNPIGAKIVKMLFEPINSDTADQLEVEIGRLIEFEPRITLRNLVIRAAPDKNIYHLYLNYQIVEIPGSYSFETKLKSFYG